MATEYFKTADGSVLVAMTSLTNSGQIRFNDKRTVYSMAGTGKRVLKAAAAEFIASATKIDREAF